MTAKILRQKAEDRRQKVCLSYRYRPSEAPAPRASSLRLLSSDFCLLVLISITTPAHAQSSVVGSPHDFSARGPGRVHALFEEQVCIFCHAPHNAAGQTALWNRSAPPTHYRIYESSTTDARIDQPGGSSKMCLSCHDGAIAIGLVASRAEPIPMSRQTMPPGPSNLTHDLSDDHPIGFRYDRALASRDPQLNSPDVLTDLLPLGPHRQMQCTTCHDPHNNELGDFLRMPTLRGALCTSCHEMHGWSACSHAHSPAVIAGRGVDPTQKLPYATVADNACLSCHRIHSAGSRERLLRFDREEDNCFSCHDGGVARINLVNEFRKRSVHPVFRTRDRHDPAEDPATMRRHVECVDCHNPHATAPAVDTSVVLRATTPRPVPPAMRFVSGVDARGREVDVARFEYEVCLKCHGDSVRRPGRGDIPRQITQTNTRLEFQTSNPSFHPVFGSRNNRDVISLLPPLRTGSVIACTDCHNSEEASSGNLSAPAGPHGSIYEPLLIANYDTGEFVTESPQAYALCYRCHDRQSILGDRSFPLHSVHIVRGRASCAACHDAHGISRTQGNASGHSNLINFDRRVVQPVSGELGQRLGFVDLGRYAGSCTLVCHGVTHVNFRYGR